MKTLLEPEDIKSIAETITEMLLPAISENNKSGADDKWFNVKELSGYLSMSPQWIYNNKSKLPHVNMKSKPLFKKSEVDHWLESFRVGAGNGVITLPAYNVRKRSKEIRSSGFNNQKKKAVTSH
jgi:hypothetical protein